MKTLYQQDNTLTEQAIDMLQLLDSYINSYEYHSDADMRRFMLSKLKQDIESRGYFTVSQLIGALSSENLETRTDINTEPLDNGD